MGALATAAASRPRADRERLKDKKAERIQRVRSICFECVGKRRGF